MKKTIKALLYIPFIIVSLGTVERINNGEVMWVIMYFVASLTLGTMCGFFPLINRFENWLKK